MASSNLTLGRVATTLGYLLLGAAGTAATGLAVLFLLQPIQRLVYDLFYLPLGPSEATETAILTHVLLAAVVALGVAAVLGDAVSDRLANRTALLGAVAVLVGMVLVFFVVALAGYAAFLTALLVLAVAMVGVPLALRYRYGVHSGGVPAFVGGVPVVVFLLLLAGFGLGWGWGYVVTAQEVPPAAANGTVADFDTVPAVRDDLFDPTNCETDAQNRRECLLSLRGYAHERAAVRFMARHGVRCPYQNAVTTGPPDTFVASHDGTYYRISCFPHGD